MKDEIEDLLREDWGHFQFKEKVRNGRGLRYEGVGSMCLMVYESHEGYDIFFHWRDMKISWRYGTAYPPTAIHTLLTDWSEDIDQIARDAMSILEAKVLKYEDY